jgi:sugar-phosphatase
MINAVIAKLGIGHHLKGIHSALFEQYGKPHPAVYISAAEKLGVTPGQCLAFEDSPNGVLSAKAAKMRCVAVPEAGTQTDKRFGIADIVVDSLADVTREMMTSL